MKRTKKIEQFLSQIEEIKAYFEELASEKQDKYDNHSEKWQSSDKGEEESDLILSLESISSAAETLYDEISDIYEE